ncbi:hypothetical protein CLU79DRAFT_835504 [Phycomyces nitens]|nr:hypothetical protein CLU79DRAFT_835504 [Phycomyces nitens]
MVPPLPYEILRNIAFFITRKDASVSSLVCKAWSFPFQASLWEKISISKDLELDNLLQKFDRAPEIYQRSGHYVRELDLGKRDDLSAITISKLQRYFPDVNTVKIEKGLWYQTHLEALPEWNQWKQLRHLTVCVPHCPNDDSFQELQRICSGLSLLQTLVILNKYSGATSAIGWETLETIHSTLPYLECLKVDSQMFRIPETDMNQIRALPPAVLLNTVIFDTENMPLEWLFYCAVKYKNIQTLKWRDTQSVGKDSPEAHSTYLEPAHYILLEKMRKFSTLPYFFSRLKNFALGENPAVAWRGGTIWQIFEELGVSLENLEFTIGIDDFLPNTVTKILTKYSKACSNTLQTLCIKAVMHTPNPAHTPCILQAVPISFNLLADLTINAQYSIIEVDDILNHCSALKKLSISAHSVCLSPVASNNDMVHSLERIELTDSKVKAGIFTYLSFRCENIGHMRLNNLTVVGLISQETGNLCVDMSKTCFKDLRIDKVTFYSMDDTNVEEYRHRNLKINIISVEHTGFLKKENGCRSSNFLGYECKSKDFSIDTLWFHCFNSPPTTNEKTMVQILSNEEIEYALKYFMAYRYKSKLQLPYPNVLCNDYGLVDDWCWTNDLHRGYVTLLCK